MRVEAAKQSWVTSNSQNIKILSELKQLHEVADRNMLTEKEKLNSFAQIGNQLQKRLTDLKMKVNEQMTKVKHLSTKIEDQLAIMKILEVDIEIKIRTCKGSCQNVQVFMNNFENDGSWKKDFDSLRNYPIDDNTKKLHKIVLVNPRVQKDEANFKKLWPLMEMKQLEMFDSVDQCSLILEDV
ncbi:fibrinogen alpha chain-like [Engystomops pustulosus]|uniref:fibrinogen alpha chain-like n=1 Tax=Engystomops pustulosus TaxID=76066 RepID=UPI003AFA0E65